VSLLVVFVVFSPVIFSVFREIMWNDYIWPWKERWFCAVGVFWVAILFLMFILHIFCFFLLFIPVSQKVPCCIFMVLSLSTVWWTLSVATFPTSEMTYIVSDVALNSTHSLALSLLAVYCLDIYCTYVLLLYPNNATFHLFHWTHISIFIILLFA